MQWKMYMKVIPLDGIGKSAQNCLSITEIALPDMIIDTSQWDDIFTNCVTKSTNTSI